MPPRKTVKPVKATPLTIQAGDLCGHHTDSLISFEVRQSSGLWIRVKGQLRQLSTTANDISINVCAPDDQGGWLEEFTVPHDRDVILNADPAEERFFDEGLRDL